MKKAMKYRDFVIVFNEMEAKERLFERKVCNVFYWKLIRIYIFNYIIQKKNYFGSFHPNNQKKNRLTLLWKELKLSLFQNASHGNHHIDYVVYRHRRRIDIDGKFVEVNTEYLDRLIPDFNNRNVEYVETGIAYGERNITKKSLFLINGPLHKVLFFCFFKFIINFSFKNEADYISDVLRRYLDENINLKPFLIKEIKNYYLSYRINYRYLKRRTPSKVYLTCSYGREGIIQAARDLGIKVYELQHGMISHIHLGYSFPKGVKIPYFPDKILLYGEFWKYEADYPINDNCLLVIGNPYVEIQKNKYSKNVKNPSCIVFISSGDYGRPLSKLAINFLKKNKACKIIYKLHPSEFGVWKTLYPDLANCTGKSLEVIEDSVNLYEIFSVSTFLVGVNSTAIYESYSYDCKVILYNTNGIEDMHSLVYNYHVPLINDEIELAEIIKSYPNDVMVNRDFIYKDISSCI